MSYFKLHILNVHVTQIIRNKFENSTQNIFKVTAILIIDIFGKKWRKMAKNTFFDPKISYNRHFLELPAR